MILLLLAAELASLQSAGDTVEIEIGASGSTEVPAQAYQINAVITVAEPKQSSEVGGAPDLLARLSKLEAPKREICTFPYPLGFVGNEAYGNEDEDDTQEASSDDGKPVGIDHGASFAPSIMYSGIFLSREKADQAIQLMHAPRPGGQNITPVLYDCGDAIELAKTEALKHAQEEAVSMASLLGMQVAGVTRIVDDGNGTSVEGALASFYTRKRDEDVVKVTRALKVTYLLRK